MNQAAKLIRNLSLAAGFAVAAWLPAASAETLSDALLAAYRTNPELATARAELRITDEELSAALSAFRPSLSLEGTGGISGVRTRNQGWNSLTPADGQILAVQPVLPLSGFAAFGTAEAQVAQGRARLASVEQAVFLDVVGAYLSVLRDQNLVKITNQIVSNLSEELEGSKRKFEGGEVSRTDIALTRTRLSQVQADNVAAQLDLRQSRSAYEEIVGHPPDNLEPVNLPPGLPGSREKATDIAMSANPAVLTARAGEEVALAGIRQAQSDLYPSVNLVASGAYEREQSLSGQRDEQYSLQLQLRVPLYEGGATQSRIRRAREVWGRARTETIVVERQVTRQVANAFDALETAADVISYAEEGLRGADAALEGVRREATLGFRTTTEVLDAELDLLSANRRLIAAEYEETLSAWQLLAAIGAFSARGIGLPTEYYDETTHANAARDAWFSTEPLAGNALAVPPSVAPQGLVAPGATVAPPVPANTEASPEVAEHRSFWGRVLNIPESQIELP